MSDSNGFITSEEAAELLDVTLEESDKLPIRWYEGPEYEIYYLLSDVQWLKEQGWRAVGNAEEDQDDSDADDREWTEYEDERRRHRNEVEVPQDGEDDVYDELTELYWQLCGDCSPSSVTGQT